MKIKDYAEKPNDCTSVYIHYPADFNPFASNEEVTYYDRRVKSNYPFKALDDKEQEYEITAVVRDALFPYMVDVYCEIPKHAEDL